MFRRQNNSKDQKTLAVLGRDSRRSGVSLLDIKEKRSRRRRHALIFASVGLALLVILGGGWLVAKSSLFELVEIRVEGNTRVAVSDILGMIQQQVLGRSYIAQVLGSHNILSWPGGVSPADVSTLPQLASLTIVRNYAARRVTVSVAERTHFGIWCFTRPLAPEPSDGERDRQEPATCFWFDQSGVIFEPAPLAEGSLLAVVTDRARDAVPLGEKVLPANFMPNFLSILTVLNRANLPIASIELNDLSLQEVKVTLALGPELDFSLHFPAVGALSVIQTLRQEPNNLSKEPWQELKLVDFRVENRAYYK